MKKNILSLVLGTTLALPTLAMAAPTDMTPANMQEAAADSAMQAEVESAESEGRSY